MNRTGLFINTCSSCGHNQWVLPNDKIFLCEKCSLVISTELNTQLYVDRPTINLLNDRTWTVNKDYKSNCSTCNYDPSLDKNLNEDLVTTF